MGKANARKNSRRGSKPAATRRSAPSGKRVQKARAQGAKTGRKAQVKAVSKATAAKRKPTRKSTRSAAKAPTPVVRMEFATPAGKPAVAKINLRALRSRF